MKVLEKEEKEERARYEEAAGAMNIERGRRQSVRDSLGDDAVEARALEVEGLAHLADALLACDFVIF